MMEVGSRARHIEQMFSPEARSPSVDTRLSLGVPAGDNKGASMSPQGTGLFPPVSNIPVPLPNTIAGYTTTLSGPRVRDEALPMSSFGLVTGIETLTMSPLGTVDDSHTTSTSPPDSGLPPSIPTAAYWTAPTMPQHLLFEPSLPNVAPAKEFDKGAIRDGGSKNVVIPPTAAPHHIEAMRVDVDNGHLDMATQASYSGESQPSQADFSNVGNGGETQLVHDSQVVEVDETQPPFAGETQPVNGDESYDDMVIFHSNTLTASATPLTNADQSVSHEPLQGTDARPSQDCFHVPALTLSNGMPAPYLTNVSTGERETHATADGPNGRVIKLVPTVNKHPEVYPAETAGQLSLTEGNEEKETIASEPRPAGLLDKNVNRKGKEEEGKSQDRVAEIGIKDDVDGNTKIVSEQDIEALKGRKVVKKFGRKNFEGEVVDYDAENQWFKVVYEDGDQEDLELLEVKEILLNTDASSKASTAKRKRSQAEGAVNDQQARKQKGTLKKKDLAAIKSPPGSKTKGFKKKAQSKSAAASAHEGSVESRPTSGEKRKISSDAKVMTSSKIELENVSGKVNSKENKQSIDVSGKVNSKENKQSIDVKTLKKSSAKRGRGKAIAKNNSARRKGTRHRSLSKLSVVESEVETAVGAGEGDGGVKRGKRHKIDASKDQDTLVGIAVKKDFGGTLHSGVVANFDKQRKYYRVEYEDGDQEDLDLEELKAVLVH